MTQVSGDQWASHMLYGTSQMLQSPGMISHFDQLDQRFFGAFKLLEANRAILYGEDTFLSQEAWRTRHENLAVYSTSPLETILNLVIQISSFSQRSVFKIPN